MGINGKEYITHETNQCDLNLISKKYFKHKSEKK